MSSSLNIVDRNEISEKIVKDFSYMSEEIMKDLRIIIDIVDKDDIGITADTVYKTVEIQKKCLELYTKFYSNYDQDDIDLILNSNIQKSIKKIIELISSRVKAHRELYIICCSVTNNSTNCDSIQRAIPIYDNNIINNIPEAELELIAIDNDNE